jgi:hypothetical protein
MERIKAKVRANRGGAPSANGHAPKGGREKTPIPAGEPVYDPGDAYEGPNVAPPAAETPPDTQEPWEPIMRLNEGIDAPSFPLDVLPEPLAALVTEGAEALPCPPDFIGIPMLVLAGAAIGATRCLHIKGNWFAKPNLYATFVASPSSKKSPAIELVAKPFYDLQESYYRENDQARKEWEESGSKDQKKKPPEKCSYIQDVTTEKIARLLLDNPRGLVKIEDELSAWFRELNVYRPGGKGRDEDFWLSGNSGNPVHVMRSNPDAPPIYVRHPFLSVIGPTTPAKLNDVFCVGEKSTGFIERILIAYPKKLPARGENWAEVSEEAIYEWEYVLKQLLYMEGEIGDYGPRPHVVRFTKCGRDAWVKFTNANAAEMNDPDFPNQLEAFWGKHEGFCARLALILHNLRAPSARREGENVDGRSVEDAAKLVRYFQGHLRKLIGMLAIDADKERCQRVLHWIEKKEIKSFRTWQLQKDVRSDSLFPDMAEIDRTLNKLVRHNYLRRRAPETKKREGRPSGDVFDVHPSL